MKLPVIPEITLSYIVERLIRDCKNEGFKLNKIALGDEVFGGYKNLQRCLKNERKISDIDCRDLLTKIKTVSGGTQEDLKTRLVSWFPMLNVYQTVEEMESIITANLMKTASSDVHIPPSDLTSTQFLQLCMRNDSPIKCIKIAAQTGWSWLDNQEKNTLLTKLAVNGVKIQVISNPASAIISKMAKAMWDSSKALRYMGLNQTIAKWHTYEQSYQTIHLRITEYPLLHQTLIVEFEDGSAEIMLRDYTYGLPIGHHSPHKQITSSNPNYYYYKTEFDFLWDSSETYDTWYASLPEPDEQIQPGNYLLLYESHEKEHPVSAANSTNWIYSALSIAADNTATLKVNISIPPSFETMEFIENYEYSYHGNLKLTGHNIFISLSDNEQQEVVHISLSRPLHDKKRFLGIMTGLSPSGQPVAFKCACIEASLLSKLNYPLLSTLLRSHNREWNDNLLVLENQDINLFYSDKLFSDKTDL